MNETNETQELPLGPRRLLRARSGRVLGGVCAGLGRYFNVDPIIFRIGAIVLALIGGAGLLAYVAALLLIPAEDSPSAAEGAPAPRNRWLAIIGVIVLLCVTWPFLLGGGLLLAGLLIPFALLVAAGVLVWWFVSGEGPSGDTGEVAKRAALGIGILILCGLIAFGGAWAAAAGGETVVAIAVIAAGVAILAGAFIKPVRWLVLPAVTLALSAGTVSAAGIDLDGGIGERDYRPNSVVDLRDTYQLGMGQLTVDLRQTDLPPGDVPMAVDLGVGDARVIVPDDVCVATDAHVRVGEVRTFGLGNEGIDVDLEDAPDAAPTVTRLLVKADVGVGSLKIGRSAFDTDFDRTHFDFGPVVSELGENTACET
ncbi:MAG TPA: PspC domain-containing protein [Thermoleophilaceae bacterium]|jgi:phage shock protein PspC (stress-responsive transcriptional regulator)